MSSPNSAPYRIPIAVAMTPMLMLIHSGPSTDRR
jgi:hypothetical protein